MTRSQAKACIGGVATYVGRRQDIHGQRGTLERMSATGKRVLFKPLDPALENASKVWLGAYVVEPEHLEPDGREYLVWW